MKRWVRLASRFYPAAWRKRYAMEFDAMLDELDADWQDFFDILKGALTMRFTSWNIKTIALTFAAIGAVVAAAVAFSIPNQYSSLSVVRITTAGATEGKVATHPLHFNQIKQQVLSRTSLEDLINGLDLYRTQRGSQPIEDIVQRMRNHDISIKVILSPEGITGVSIRTAYQDPKMAQAINRKVLTKFIDENIALGRTGGSSAVTSLEVLDPPSEPQQPIYPRKAQFVFAGLSGGLLIGLLVSLMLGWRILFVRRSAQ